MKRKHIILILVSVLLPVGWLLFAFIGYLNLQANKQKLLEKEYQTLMLHTNHQQLLDECRKLIEGCKGNSWTWTRDFDNANIYGFYAGGKDQIQQRKLPEIIYQLRPLSVNVYPDSVCIKFDAPAGRAEVFACADSREYKVDPNRQIELLPGLVCGVDFERGDGHNKYLQKLIDKEKEKLSNK